ncbi:hypothetical protein DICPUDRAFT_28616 [Dictyostelium purpureum]|uniref:ABC transporter domain-containing protein n=1 Tax=Dictyostelium purpureum TaxID=5786 RepID=F0ZC87_DICPU|nr:uncharacterized protein DICPUDRAFT_28616 [Dictyostelium purpureum]EGC38478.1 hypothetical protein DICPUDRAFT_28616 [Dictyostelium purpureum]|eukprot:XP_003285036.1 hypothetical protein DICPUDRAFT_28616 [Dictyostelium purpureum]
MVPIPAFGSSEIEINDYFDNKNRVNTTPITICLNNLNVELKDNFNKLLSRLNVAERKPNKMILRNVNTIIKPGQLTAILGGSGSGKTTLLNTISGRYSKKEMKVKGDIQFNNFTPSPDLIRRAVGYVMQKDYPLPNLTVRETLMFSASLRLPDNISKQEIEERVERIILELNLKDCANTRVGGGGATRTGCSGGEKRRLSVGCQLLTDPSCLFLDEPTTGLDSSIAFELIKTLSKIAHKQNRTIICTIHQPQVNIFKMFDQVILLSKGRMVYNGPSTEMVQYFTSIGYPCPQLQNPADHYLDICSVDYRNEQLEEQSTQRLEKLVINYEAAVIDKEYVNNQNLSDLLNEYALKSQLRSKKSFYKCVPILTLRTYKNHLRDVPAAITRVSQIVSFGIMMALCFLRIGHDQPGIQNMTGFLYQSLSLIFIALLSCVALFPTERNLFYRERNDGLYSTSSFFISYMFVELPFNVIGTLGYSAVCYFSMGLKMEADKYFMFCFVIFLLLFSGESVGLFVCSLFYDVGLATTFANVFLSMFTILAGFFRPTDQMPAVLRYFNYILPTKWAAEVYSVNQLKGEVYTCPGKQSLDGEGKICPVSNGEQVLTRLGWIDVNIYHSLAVLIGISIFYRLIVFITLKYNRRNTVL